MAYTKEQRAAKAAAAAKAEQPEEQRADAPAAPEPAEKPASVLMTKDGIETLVNNNESVQIMEALGWALKD